MSRVCLLHSCCCKVPVLLLQGAGVDFMFAACCAATETLLNLHSALAGKD